MRILRNFMMIAGLLMAALPALAHSANESYLFFNVTDDALSGRVEATLPDIDELVPLDADDDGEITREEATVRQNEIFAAFTGRLTIFSEGQAYTPRPTGLDFLDTPTGIFAQLRFALDGLSPVPEAVEIQYDSPFQDQKPGHLGYAIIESNSRTGVADNEAHISLIFEPGDTRQALSLVAPPWHQVFIEFVEHGVWHIWLGFDHVVFLVTLLLPAVMVLTASGWAPAPNFRAAMWNVLKLVTVFTISHSVTLSLAALNILTLPVTLVEWIIAFSIAFVALGNIYPIAHRHTLWVVFVFGLFHGFGFANVLEPLGVNPAAKVVGLAAFNIGVELGQVALVAVLFPLLFAVRKWSGYPFVALRLASVVFILLAGAWLAERSPALFDGIQRTLLSSTTAATVSTDAA